MNFKKTEHGVVATLKFPVKRGKVVRFRLPFNNIENMILYGNGKKNDTKTS